MAGEKVANKTRAGIDLFGYQKFYTRGSTVP